MKTKYLSVLLWALGFCVVGFVSSCSSEDPENIEPAATPEEEPVQPTAPVENPENLYTLNLTSAEQSVNKNLNDFSLKLFNAVSSPLSVGSIGEPVPDFAVSPVSMAIALAMCANVCDDDFTSGVLYALGCEDIADLNSLCSKLMTYLPDSSCGSDILLTNALWHNNGTNPSSACRTAINDYFFGDISAIDFSDTEAAANTINSWAARSTKDVIKSVVDADDLQFCKVFLANALYFKGEWAAKFSKSNTVSREFHGSNGGIDVDFMCDKRVMPYVACERFQAVTLGYKGTCEMIAVLPTEGLDIDDFSSTFDTADFSRCIGERAKYTVNLSLPKFESEITMGCDAFLSKIGIDMSKARVSEINGAANQVLSMGHTAKVSTDEDGTVAAAVTSGFSMLPGEPEVVGEVTLNFDRPFIYFIRNVKTGSIIMAGRFAK